MLELGRTIGPIKRHALSANEKARLLPLRVLCGGPLDSLPQPESYLSAMQRQGLALPEPSRDGQGNQVSPPLITLDALLEELQPLLAQLPTPPIESRERLRVVSSSDLEQQGRRTLYQVGSLVREKGTSKTDPKSGSMFYEFQGNHSTIVYDPLTNVQLRATHTDTRGDEVRITSLVIDQNGCFTLADITHVGDEKILHSYDRVPTVTIPVLYGGRFDAETSQRLADATSLFINALR